MGSIEKGFIYLIRKKICLVGWSSTVTNHMRYPYRLESSNLQYGWILVLVIFHLWEWNKGRNTELFIFIFLPANTTEETMNSKRGGPIPLFTAWKKNAHPVLKTLHSSALTKGDALSDSDDFELQPTKFACASSISVKDKPKKAKNGKYRQLTQ